MNRMGIILLILLTGCNFLPTRTEYVKVSYPILICPAPPKLERPKLYINLLSDTDLKNYGKVAKYYDISLQQLFGYIKSLELIINQYNETSKSYEGLKAEVEKMAITPAEK